MYRYRARNLYVNTQNNYLRNKMKLNNYYKKIKELTNEHQSEENNKKINDMLEKINKLFILIQKDEPYIYKIFRYINGAIKKYFPAW